MARYLLILCCSFSLAACTKSTSDSGVNNSLASTGITKQDAALNPTDSGGIFGEWQLISFSDIGPIPIIPSPDSVVTLTLNPPNIYAAGLNGKLVIGGTFNIAATNYSDETMHFNGIPETTYDSSNTGYTIISFGSIKVGQLYFSPDQSVYFYNDTLSMIREPITPEALTAIFKKLR